ncbi:per os infectivity factor 1, partial [Nephila pilipes]
MVNGQAFMKCICKYPNLITQSYDGGNCDVGLACEPHGKLERTDVDPLKFGKCNCDDGYKPGGNLTCVKMLPFEQQKLFCKSDEVYRRNANQIFHPDYLSNIPPLINCLKIPCKHNIFN